MQSPARDPHRLIAAVGHQAGLEHVVPERDLPRGPFQAVGKLVVAERDVQALQQDLRLPGAAVVRQFQLRVDPARGKKIDPRLLERLGQGVHQPVVELQVAELGLQPLGTGLVEAGAAEGSDPQRRRAARGQQVVHRDPLVAHAERRAKVRQRMGQPAVVDVALDQPPAELEPQRRRRGRVVAQAEAERGLPPQRTQLGQPLGKHSGQGLAELGGDGQPLDGAGQRPRSPVRIDQALDVHLVEILAGHGAAELPHAGAALCGRPCSRHTPCAVRPCRRGRLG